MGIPQSQGMNPPLKPNRTLCVHHIYKQRLCKRSLIVPPCRDGSPTSPSGPKTSQNGSLPAQGRGSFFSHATYSKTTTPRIRTTHNPLHLSACAVPYLREVWKLNGFTRPPQAYGGMRVPAFRPPFHATSTHFHHPNTDHRPHALPLIPCVLLSGENLLVCPAIWWLEAKGASSLQVEETLPVFSPFSLSPRWAAPHDTPTPQPPLPHPLVNLHCVPLRVAGAGTVLWGLALPLLPLA